MKMIKYFGRQFSRFLARHPNLLFAIQHRWLKIGYSFLDLTMADWVIRRPEWLRAKSTPALKYLEPELPEANIVEQGIAERLVSMAQKFASAKGDALVPSDSMWGTLRQTHYAPLLNLVESGDVPALARFQQSIFRTDCVNGFTYGSTFDNWPHRWHYLPIQIELSVVQLAETIGLLRAECHEQGEIAFWRSLVTEEELVRRIEDFFGFRLEQPRFGDPRGIFFGGRFLTRETCSHLNSAYRMKTAIEKYGNFEVANVLEIGGGFGGTCFWLRKILGERMGRYIIVDLPEVALVQASFLGAVDPNALILRGEQRPEGKQTIELVPHFLLDEIDMKPTVLINQDSMPEMPQSEVERYVNWASQNLDGLFLSFNQETFSHSGDLLQVHVPSIISENSRFVRVSRDTSWDRRGYVEEVYRTI